MNLERIFGAGIGVILAWILAAILFFLLLRWFWCWYLKINARLREQEKTNELLQNIFDALVQGNAVSAVTAGQIIGMNETQGENTPSASVNVSDIPDL